MIAVQIEAVKSEGRGVAGGNGWHDTDDVIEAITREFKRFERTWSGLGHGAAGTYRITVATEASPRRTRSSQRLPLPELP